MVHMNWTQHGHQNPYFGDDLLRLDSSSSAIVASHSHTAVLRLVLRKTVDVHFETAFVHWLLLGLSHECCLPVPMLLTSQSVLL